MGTRENECQILPENYILHMKFSEFYKCFGHSFSPTPIRNFLWCRYR